MSEENSNRAEPQDTDTTGESINLGDKEEIQVEDLAEYESLQNAVTLLDIIDKVADRAEPLIELMQSVADQYKSSRADRAAFRFKMTVAAIVLVLVIVGIAGFLTYAGRLDGSTFGFLLGLVVGYLLTFVRDAIGPTATDEF